MATFKVTVEPALVIDTVPAPLLIQNQSSFICLLSSDELFEEYNELMPFRSAVMDTGPIWAQGPTLRPGQSLRLFISEFTT